MVTPEALSLMSVVYTKQVWFVDDPVSALMVTFRVNVLVAPTPPEIAESAAEIVGVAPPATDAVIAVRIAAESVATALTPVVLATTQSYSMRAENSSAPIAPPAPAAPLMTNFPPAEWFPFGMVTVMVAVAVLLAMAVTFLLNSTLEV